MAIPEGYVYTTHPTLGNGYWKSDGTGPYRFNGTSMVLMYRSGLSAASHSGLANADGTLWAADGSGPYTVD